MADPICTFIFAILVLLTTKAILRDISDILMERVPRQIDIDQLEQGMLAVGPLFEWSVACHAAFLARRVSLVPCCRLPLSRASSALWSEHRSL